MSKRFAQVIVLVEDKQQRSFVSRLLQELGYPVHKLKVLPIPAGEGSGEAYVREQYPIQVKALRSRAPYQDVALVVAIDGDGRTEEERKKQLAKRQKQLADQLVAANITLRTEAEKIIHLVPCRNIEAWIEYLEDMTKPIDETEEYPKFTGHERACKKAVEEMARLCRSNQPLPPNCPQSLAAAIAELKRLG